MIEYIEAVEMGDAFIGAGMFILFLTVAIILIRGTERRKSHNYRKYLTNLYVSSKIRELAKKNNLDLTAEEKKFIKYVSLSKKDRIRDLDDNIELDLSEQILNQEKKQEEKQEEKQEKEA